MAITRGFVMATVKHCMCPFMSHLLNSWCFCKIWKLCLLALELVVTLKALGAQQCEPVIPAQLYKLLEWAESRTLEVVAQGDTEVGKVAGNLQRQECGTL